MEHHEPSTQEHGPAATERVTTGKARRYLVAAAMLSAAVTAGAVFSPVGLANAQSDDTSSSDSSSDSSPSDSSSSEDDPGDAPRDGKGGHGHRGHRGSGVHLEELATALGLEASELRAQLAAGSTLAEVAEAQGVDTEVLVDAMTAHVGEHLDAAVAAGRIDQDTADTRLAEAEERFRDRLDDEITPRAPGRGGFGGLEGMREGISELADSLGLDLDVMREAVAGGQTVAEAAEAQGVSPEELSAALVEAAQERIDEAVENGRIDEDRAAELEAGIADRVDAMINRSLGDGLGRGFGGRHHGGPGRFGPDADADADADADGETQESGYTA